MLIMVIFFGDRALRTLSICLVALFLIVAFWDFFSVVFLCLLVVAVILVSEFIVVKWIEGASYKKLWSFLSIKSGSKTIPTLDDIHGLADRWMDLGQPQQETPEGSLTPLSRALLIVLTILNFIVGFFIVLYALQR